MGEPKYNINLVGDVMLGRLVDQLFPDHIHAPEEARKVRPFVSANSQLKEYGPSSPWGDTLSLFEQSDLNMANLETSVTVTDNPWPEKMFNYRMHPFNLKALQVAQIDYVSLANNHTLDFSEEGFEETMKAVASAGISFAGAGFSKDAAESPVALTVPSALKQAQSPQRHKIHRIQVWSAADHPREWSSVPGFHLIDYSSATRKRLKDLIMQSQDPSASLKMFSIHWGPNYSWHPAKEIRSLAHFLIDECGIDIIHGHSSHHIQGVEQYKGKLIIYGCGDFVDDYAVTAEFRNDISAVWRVGLSEERDQLVVNKLEVFPTKIKLFQAQRLQVGDPDRDWTQMKFTDLCRRLGTKVEREIGLEGQIEIKF